MAWLIVQELPELSRGGLAVERVRSVRRSFGLTAMSRLESVQRMYPGFELYGPVGPSIPAGLPFIALNVYLSQSKDGVGRNAGNMELWRAVVKAKKEEAR